MTVSDLVAQHKDEYATDLIVVGSRRNGGLVRPAAATGAAGAVPSGTTPAR